VHRFTGGNSEGANPYSPLVRDQKGNLYGTTRIGGPFGSGTIFRIDASGNLSTLYNFTGLADGAYPNAGLVMGSEDRLYGAAALGGLGYGTVFQFKLEHR
jgi:uncharacterized repeat protein (TIGR03803 family)